MQYYTKQQLQGSARYGGGVLLGNWNEDRCIKETILKDFLDRCGTKQLKIDKFQANMAQAMAPAELSVVRDDGNVHFGDMVQLAHAGPTASVLAADIHDADRRTGQHACAATASPQARAPCARNTLLLAKYHSERLDISTTHYEDSVLRYGQKIRVIVNPAVKGQELDAGGGPEPLCLFSKPVGPQHFAKYSHHQIVGFTTRSGYDTVFQVVTPDPAQRLASEGVEVAAGVPVCLQHCATSALLCLEPHTYPNEFGADRELSFKTVKSNGKKLLLVHEAQGELSALLPPTQPLENQFRFVVGSTVKELPLPKSDALEVNDALARVNAALLRSSLGYTGFREKLLRMDMNGSGKVNAAEVQLALSYAGAQLEARDMALVATHFGTAQHGVVDVRALLARLEMLDTQGQA